MQANSNFTFLKLWKKSDDTTRHNFRKYKIEKLLFFKLKKITDVLIIIQPP